MLEWQLQHGSNEKAVRDTSAKTGMPLPDFILNKPNLLPGLLLFWQAFNELEDDRPEGFSGQGRIPWRSKNDYLRAHHWDDDATFCARFRTYLSKMDNAYMAFYSEKAKHEKAKSDAASRSKGKKRR